MGIYVEPADYFPEDIRKKNRIGDYAENDAHPSISSVIVKHTWVEFFAELANKLLPYRGRGEELIDKISEVYAHAQRKNEKLKNNLTREQLAEHNVDLNQVDPFTVFGVINRGLTDANRIALCEGFKSVFDMSTEVPSDFNGIPVLQMVSSWIGATDYDLWDLFEAAMNLADHGTDQEKFIRSYDSFRSNHIGIRYITFGLFWIRPEYFISLDSRNEALIKAQFPNVRLGNLSNLDAKAYLALCEDLRNEYKTQDSIKDNILLSIAAWSSSSYYIFQCNPKVYDIDSALQNLDQMTYTVNKNYIRKMLPFITVYIWESGNDGGIVAKAMTISDVGSYTDEAGDQYYYGGPPAELTENKVWIQFTEIPETKISRETIKNHPVLKDLTILKFAQGTTFPITEEQAMAIEEILSGNYVETPAEEIDSDPDNPAIPDSGLRSTHYWMYSPGNGAFLWDDFYEEGIMAIGWGEIGDLTAFHSKDEMRQKMKEVIDPSKSHKNSAHATWQFANEMKVGDVIFAKRGMHTIIGRGVVESDYYYNDDEKRGEYRHIRKVRWTHNGEWPHPGQAVMKTLTDITPYTEYVAKLNAFFESEDPESEDSDEKVYPAYSKEQFLDEVFMAENEYDALKGLLLNKKNVILQGAPGVGKTYAAKRLAYSIIGSKNKDRVMMVQFHQSYSYEDFIQGYRPTEDGYDLKNGAFYTFCKNAEIDSDNEYFFIIDEINRGNLSKIFGELFMLIENDKRGIELQLLYSEEMFSVPKNVYIIGMMNTADRSLAMLDYALRRRFAFFEMKPGFNTEGFQEYRKALNNPSFDKLIDCIERLNAAIATDDSLGEGFCIGHSYFCNFKEIDDQALSSIVEYEIIPLLKEYWFDDPVKVKNWSNDLRSSIK